MGKSLCYRVKFKKKDPPFNSILHYDHYHPIHTDFSKACQWHRFDFGLTFTLLYSLNSNLLSNFLMAVLHLLLLLLKITHILTLHQV